MRIADERLDLAPDSGFPDTAQKQKWEHETFQPYAENAEKNQASRKDIRPDNQGE